MSKVIILTGAPADAATIAALNEKLAQDGLPPWTPKVDYTIFPCDECGTGVWIGPRQKAVRDAEGPDTARILCIMHANQYADALGGIDTCHHLGGGDGPSRL